MVVPKALREQFSLEPGDEVEFERRGDTIVLIPHRSTERLGGRYARSGMAARLLVDRADEPR